VNIMPPSVTLPDLWASLSLRSPASHRPAGARLFAIPATGRGAAFSVEALHEVYAASTRHGPAAEGFGLGLALQAAGTLVWIHEDRGRHEVGTLYGSGLREWGVGTDDLLVVRVPDTAALLAAGEEALRSPAPGAVLMSGWGASRAFTLTASRRLAMAAAAGRTMAVFVRTGVQPQPSAAETRWSVQAARSGALEAGAPGRPALKVSLLRSRAGLVSGECIMEWDRDARSFVEPKTSGDLVSASAHRQAGSRAA
jgi:protein ImuA